MGRKAVIAVIALCAVAGLQVSNPPSRAATAQLESHALIDWRGAGGRPGASSAARRRIRPSFGHWSGPAEPGWVSFTIGRNRSGSKAVKHPMHVFGRGVCSSGRTLHFDFESSPGDNTLIPIISSEPGFWGGFNFGGRAEAEGIEGRFYVSGSMRFTSNGRAKGGFSVQIWTNNPEWGDCRAVGSDERYRVRFHATRHG